MLAESPELFLAGLGYSYDSGGRSLHELCHNDVENCTHFRIVAVLVNVQRTGVLQDAQGDLTLVGEDGEALRTARGREVGEVEHDKTIQYIIRIVKGVGGAVDVTRAISYALLMAKNEKFKGYVLGLVANSKHRTQRNVAEAMGITPQHLNSVLNGRNEPGRVFFADLAREVGADPAELSRVYEQGEKSEAEEADGFLAFPLMVRDVAADGHSRLKQVRSYVGFREEWVHPKGSPVDMTLFLSAPGMPPVIPERSIVLVDRGVTQLVPERIYVFGRPGQMGMIRRVAVRDGDTYLCDGLGECIKYPLAGGLADHVPLGLVRWFCSELA